MIYLMRHGLDDERFIGGYSNNHLTNDGVRSVCQARDYIVNKGLVINKIFTSDILRAIETADIVNTKLHVPVIQMKYLRELDKGLLNGLNLEIANTYYNEWMNVKDIYKRFPEGESLSDLYNRILYYYHDILKEDNTLLVTHRGVINMIYYILTNTKLDYNKERFNVTHSSIHEYDPTLKKIKRIY